MMTIVSYDVSTIDKAGKVRLRKVAKTLENFAQRVQNSLFEVNVDYATFLTLKNELLKIIDEKQDSLRFYYLGNNWGKKVEHFGKKQSYDSEGLIMF